MGSPEAVGVLARHGAVPYRGEEGPAPGDAGFQRPLKLDDWTGLGVEELRVGRLACDTRISLSTTRYRVVTTRYTHSGLKP